jgi:hypothetical protein
MPDHGAFAAVTDANGPRTHILYRDLRLEGRSPCGWVLRRDPAFSSPTALAYDSPRPTNGTASTSSPLAPDRLGAKGDVLANVFHTRQPIRPRQPTEVPGTGRAGQTVRLRLATTDNQGPLRVGVDNIRFRGPAGRRQRVEPLVTPSHRAPSSVLHRLTQPGAGGAHRPCRRAGPG